MQQIKKINPNQMEDLSFYNPQGSNLRKAQMRMLSILDVFAGICEKHNLDYWLYAGTALGVRRHNGFIPWDDDLDVVVRQKDFKKLTKILEDELPPNLKLQTRKTDKNYRTFNAKIRDLNSVYHEKGSERYKYKGIFIDIFPIEQVPSVSLKRFIDSVLNSPNSLMQNRGFFRKLRNIFMLLLFPLAILIIFISRMYYRNTETGILTYYYGWPDHKVLKLSYFFPVGKMKFEGKNYNVPGEIDEYLACHFGKDFMNIPPINKRQVHSSKIEIF